ncbi:nuclear transport factor 2 family protein [Aeromicrobium sp.]|uniref:nuclear transport factor 2 family protein n=1 Tax=Aeromicrobium sp. TaxID=1871063 RepID=UPI0025C54D3C|nr:nuclear transport factor 2 family protein [Aeromicrobium sp.]MCK5892579.1 nuclear transport factor 2 family protein [Aeromicrobium sp.]
MTHPEIAALYDAYGRAFDEGRPDDYVETFTPDGRFTLPDGNVVEGRDGLHRLASRAASSSARSHHFVRNLQVEVSGETATGTAHAIAVAVAGDAVELLVAGVYRDTLVRTPDGWRFATRTVTPLGPEQL